MAGVWDKSRADSASSRWLQSAGKKRAAKKDWRKRMSDNVAYALLAYTTLQIFVTMQALKGEGGSILPYLVLVLLVGAIIPACRRFERRWMELPDTLAFEPSLKGKFRRDQLVLWLLAIGLPFLLTALFTAIGRMI